MTTSHPTEEHQQSSNHRNAVLGARQVGCFYCRRLYDPVEITDWVDKDSAGIGQTAICPHCGIDAVIPARVGIDVPFLEAMHRRWFIMYRPATPVGTVGRMTEDAPVDVERLKAELLARRAKRRDPYLLTSADIATLDDAELDDRVWARLVSEVDPGDPEALMALPEGVRAYLATRLFEWEVGNGGLHQYFFNYPDPDLLALVLDGYTHLGLHEQRRIVEEVVAPVAEAERPWREALRDGTIEGFFEVTVPGRWHPAVRGRRNAPAGGDRSGPPAPSRPGPSERPGGRRPFRAARTQPSGAVIMIIATPTSGESSHR